MSGLPLASALWVVVVVVVGLALPFAVKRFLLAFFSFQIQIIDPTVLQGTYPRPTIF